MTPFARITLVLFVLLLLTACNMGASNASPTLTIPEMATNTHLTVVANMGEITQPPPATDTPPAPAATAPPDNTGLTDAAAFVKDITIPDFSNIEAGRTFDKTWEVENTGDSTWTTAYNLVFLDGDQMGAPAKIALPGDVPPGSTVELTVTFTAPQEFGQVESFWILENPSGVQFGVGNNADRPVFTIINVVEAGQGDAVGGLEGGAEIASVELKVDVINYVGACPGTFTFSYTITPTTDGIINHKMDLIASTVGFTFDQLNTTVDTVVAGEPFTITNYPITVTSSVQATAQVAVTGSKTVLSNIIAFSATCQ